MTVINFTLGLEPSNSHRYVHANYRFIVNPKGDYRAQAVDADVHLDWGMVLQILASAQTQSASCPICLSTPVAPRMAKCGHMFCLPCLIRYMHSTDESNPVLEKRARFKKCPICWDSIYISETRPVRWFMGQEADIPGEGDDIVLRLMVRQPGSTLALPRDGAEALGPLEDVPWYHVAEVADFARIMKGGEDYMVSQFDEEIRELQKQEHEDELMFGDENTWTRKAVAAINDAKEKVSGIGNPPNVPRQPSDKRPKRPPIQFNESNEDVPEMYTIQHASKSGQSIPAIPSTPQNDKSADSKVATTASLDSLAPDTTADQPNSAVTPMESKPNSSRQNGNMNQRQASINYHQRPQDFPFYYYLALPNYYLSPLDIRVLKFAFGDFSQFPSTVLPRVEHVSTGHVVDDDLRKRAKYLGHLPYGCEVSFLECDWRDLVSPEILEKFGPELERRRKKHQDKATREEKDRIRAEKDEDEQRWALARRRRPVATGKSFSEEDFKPLASDRADEASHSLNEDSGSSASPPYSSNRTGSAFASLASPSTSPSAQRTVWGTTAVAPLSPTLQAAIREAEAADDGWLQGWEKDLLQEDELVAQVANQSLGESSSGAVTPAGGGGKKKKGKKITLMSTNARRGA